jgi:hypothetical protein
VAVARLERNRTDAAAGSPTDCRGTFLSATAIVVLCVLRDYGAMTEGDLADVVPGGSDLLPRLRGEGYVECHDVPGRRARWGLTDKGSDFVDGVA